MLAVPPRSLVVLAGLPGAGKTTLLRRLAERRPARVRALDAEEVAAQLRTAWLPYRLLRPLVHGLHLLRVVREVGGTAVCVLTTDPMTSPLRRALLRAAARGTGRALCVVLVDATPEQARLGQAARGRALGARRMARHVSRGQHLRAQLHRTGDLPFVDEVLVLARDVAHRTGELAVDEAGLNLQRPRRRAS